VPPVRVDLTTHLASDPDLVAVVRDALTAARLQPADIQLGLPIESIVAGSGDAVDNVHVLAEFGVPVVLTRYGHAASDLVLLESLPVRGVELAGLLVRAAERRPNSAVRAALANLLMLIRGADTAVVVSGIDNAEQARWWRDAGADSARGVAVAKPEVPKDVPGHLEVVKRCAGGTSTTERLHAPNPAEMTQLTPRFTDHPRFYAEVSAPTSGIPPGAIGPTRARALRRLRESLAAAEAAVVVTEDD
jgi:EAL domain-containing protein (putative c-di-GMP-specific phosphodiesterase class I)